jgi:hypothetical protein
MIRCDEAQRTVQDSRGGQRSRSGGDSDLYTLSSVFMD